MFAYQIILASQISLMFVYQVQELGCGQCLTTSFLPYIAITNGDVSEDSNSCLLLCSHSFNAHCCQWKKILLHSYILNACSFLEAGKSNIHHFVSHLCLKSICSTCGDAQESKLLLPFSASLAHVHSPAFNILTESDSISNSLTIPFRFAHMKKKSNEYLAIVP